MSGAIQLTEVDFDQIKENLIDYLKSTKKFTDYDFDGSNLQVILNLISYQAQLNAYNTNMIANESFLASASLRNNVVANARMVGFVPNSTRASAMFVNMSYQLDSTQYPSGFPRYLQLEPGGAFSAAGNGVALNFNCIDTQTAAVSTSGVANFAAVLTKEGTFLTAEYTKNSADYDQRFIISNPSIDTTTIRVEVQENPNQDGRLEYREARNLVSIDENSRIYWVEEVDDGHYELIFGDGFFGKALADGAKIFVKYITTNGVLGNGINSTAAINFIGKVTDSYGTSVIARPQLLAVSTSDGGAELEDVASIKYRAPRYQAAQNRAVTVEDYVNIIKDIYPSIDDIHVYGGDELDDPQYGRVFIAIKPKSGPTLSTFTKNYIRKSLEDYRIASIDIALVDPEVVYTETVTTVYYDNRVTNKDNASITAAVKKTLDEYSSSSSISNFGGSVRYSRIVSSIDDADQSITRNNTQLRMRRDLPASIGVSASYELCFDNEFRPGSVFSTSFQLLINGETDGINYFFEDDGEGKLRRFYFDSASNKVIVDKEFGTIDYKRGDIKIGYQVPVTFVNTSVDNNIIEVRCFPQAPDVIAKRSVSINLDVAKSDIVSVVDTNNTAS